MAASKRAVFWGLCIAGWALGFAVAVPLVFFGTLMLANGLAPSFQLASPVSASLLLASLLLPVVLSWLLFFWRLAGWMWILWWSLVVTWLVVDAFATTALHPHSLPAALSVSPAMWASALIATVAVFGVWLLQVWVAATVSGMRGWAPVLLATPERWRHLRRALAPLTITFTVALVTAWGPPAVFEAARWRATGTDTTGPGRAAWGDNTRARMAPDLMARHLLPGMTQEQVTALLGEPDQAGIYALFPRPTASQTLMAMAYWGGLCPGLQVEFPWNPAGPQRLTGARIMRSYIGYID